MRSLRIDDFALRATFSIAPFAMVDCASAACAPVSPVGTSSARAVTDMPQ